MEQFEDNPKKRAAEEKAIKYGELSLTAEEHRFIGSTPPDNLIDNPGKNKVDLMTDKDLKEYLEKQSKNLEIIKASGKEQIFRTLDGQFKASLRYLEEIGRLPEEFKK